MNGGLYDGGGSQAERFWDGDDFGVLQLAHVFEGVTGFWRCRPPLARDARL